MSTEQVARPARPGFARWRLARPSVRDAAIAVVATIVGVAAAYGEAHPSTPGTYFVPPHHLPDTPAAALLLVAGAGAVLAWRHRYPRLVAAASTALVIAYTLPGYENGAALLLPAVALGTLATTVPIRWSAAWTVVVTALLMAATAVSNPLGEFGGGFFLIPATNAVALFAGIAIASRHAYVESVRVQAARRAEQEAQRRVDEERLRIARELHDVVAHTMATITVQAAAATQLLRDRPDEAAESLRSIRAAGKDGLRELRATLDLLRSAPPGAGGAGPGEAGTGDAGAGEAAMAEIAGPPPPAPGLDRLDALAAGVRAAGLPVTVTVAGQPRDLPAVTGLSAFRIIQEALTNTLRHAGPATATVTVDYAADALRLEVTDTGCGAAGFPGRPVGQGGVPAGHGLRGMRERAAVAGGTLETGPLTHGGFRVAARLPLDEAPPADQAAGCAGSTTSAGSAAEAGR
jgi:signal transduction histidine kinase